MIFVVIDRRSEKKKEQSIPINELLKLMVHTIWKVQDGKIRANVMLPTEDKKSLKIMFSYNMEGDIDRNLTIPITSGCSGNAYKGEEPIIVDLTKARHETYLIEGKKIWKEMKSILSVPLIDSKDSENSVIGVLSVDTNLDYEKIGFEDAVNPVNRFADLIKSQLELSAKD